MLVSFTLQNYRSFSDQQSIIFTSGSSSKRKEKYSFETGNSLAPNLLRSICLFGANGSGKSSLVNAFEFLKDFIVSSAKDTQQGERIDISSFKFSDEWRDEPSEFEIVFLYKGNLYQYGFALDTKRVWSEWLFYTPNISGTNSRTRSLFQREFDIEQGEYQWKLNRLYLKGEKELWKKSTRDNALFLSTAVQLKSEDLSIPFEWIQNFMHVIPSVERISPTFTASRCDDDPKWKSKVLKLLHSVDVSIDDFQFQSEEFTREKLKNQNIPEELLKEIEEQLKGKKVLKISSVHKDNNGQEVPLDFEEESEGTKVLFSLAGPWFDILENGYTLIVDELHNSLHPNALKYLVEIFHDPALNQNGAQLIFTSHETSVMAQEVLHQDEIWFVEKTKDKNSIIKPLSDFSVRNASRIQKSYLDGRYGAVPKTRALKHA